MGYPAKLECSICGETYYLHPSGEQPIEYADLCNTCAAFKQGMWCWNETVTRKRVTLGVLILGFSVFCVGLLVIWAVWSSMR